MRALTPFLLFVTLIALGACSGSGHSSGGGGGGAASGGGGGSAGGGSGGGTGAGLDAGAPYTVTVLDHARIQSPNGTGVADAGADAGLNLQQVKAGFSLTGAPFASVKLVADLSSTCFPFSSWQQNPPPTGQNWPADCDAFDRNFEFSLDDPGDGGPSHEVIRAITPFGGPLHFEQDLTDAMNFAPGPHVLKVAIGTWSDPAGQVSGSNGGWTVSAHLEVVPGAAPRHVLAVIPLVNSSDGPDAGRDLPFTLPPGTQTAMIEYRATGHGGAAGDSACIGPAEEFCQRHTHLRLDGLEVGNVVLWRTDCASLCTLAHYGNPGFDYCQENPCGAIQSVQAPRANWCPGSLTPPLQVDSATIGTPGPHDFSYSIDGVATGGTWRVSAVVYAYGP